MLSDLTSPEPQGLLQACSLLDQIQLELKDGLNFSGGQRAQWHSKNEVRIAQLLLLAEQAQVSPGAYDQIKAKVPGLIRFTSGS